MNTAPYSNPYAMYSDPLYLMSSMKNMKNMKGMVILKYFKNKKKIISGNKSYFFLKKEKEF
jgi:hypothetical protein